MRLFNFYVFRVRPKIPINKEIEPLLERDRDERKFDIFLTYHRTNLLLSDLKIFLPFTINLDPYIKKVIKGKRKFICHIDNKEYIKFFIVHSLQRTRKTEGGVDHLSLSTPDLQNLNG